MFSTMLVMPVTSLRALRDPGTLGAALKNLCIHIMNQAKCLHGLSAHCLPSKLVQGQL